MAINNTVVRKWLAPIAFGLLAVTNFAGAATTTKIPTGTNVVDLVGINVSGAEFTPGTLPGVHGKHYFFPPKDYFQKWSEKGIRTIRFPLKWERLQPSLNKGFDSTYAGLIDKMLNQAAENDIEVILDVHNYARYRGKIIGSKEVPYSAYRNLTERMAQRWSKHPGLYGYDIMNEPYGTADKNWPTAAQHGINGIRRYDREHPILIEGMSYSSASRWHWYADRYLALNDPIDNLIFSAHVYLDSDGSGTYKSGPGSKFDMMVGVKRVQPFVKWLKKHNKRGHIGEIGIPGNDARWLKAMDNTMAYLQENCIPLTYFAAGPAWGTHKLSIEPDKKTGKEKSQWKVMQKYVGEGGCPEIGPTP